MTVQSLVDDGSATSVSPSINSTSTPENVDPWENKPLEQQVFEIIYLVVLSLVGTLGNLTVIFSIALEKRVHSHGNVFVINLAVADLLVTGFVVPTVLANVIVEGNALAAEACVFTGYVVTVTCTCSLYNLTAIAINRYCAVVHSSSYVSKFTKRNVYIMAAVCWIWSCLLALPPLVGWSRIMYDPKIQLCSWDDMHEYSYTIFITTLAIIVPLCVIFFCYIRLFLTVKKRGDWVRGLTTVAKASCNRDKKKRSIRKERNLLQTLATTVAFFCICWVPYGLCVLIDANGVEPLPKKIVGWLGLSNSAVNFIIYGAMNPVFRRGYRNLFCLVIRCQKQRRTTTSFYRGTHSDSLYRSVPKRRATSNPPLCNNNVRTPRMNVRQNSAPNLNQYFLSTPDILACSSPQKTDFDSNCCTERSSEQPRSTTGTVVDKIDTSNEEKVKRITENRIMSRTAERRIQMNSEKPFHKRKTSI